MLGKMTLDEFVGSIWSTGSGIGFGVGDGRFTFEGEGPYPANS